jgi:hypothetical protein
MALVEVEAAAFLVGEEGFNLETQPIIVSVDENLEQMVVC